MEAAIIEAMGQILAILLRFLVALREKITSSRDNTEAAPIDAVTAKEEELRNHHCESEETVPADCVPEKSMISAAILVNCPIIR